MKTFFKKNGATQKNGEVIIPSDLYPYKKTDEVKNRRITRFSYMAVKENLLFYNSDLFIK